MDSILGLVRHPGNDALFHAIEMSLLATLAGQPLHIHAEGLRGTGKTTIMRAARRVLPRIRRIKGCLYNCDPLEPHCPAHRGLRGDQVSALGDEWVPMPFLEISHSAKIGTVVGSIDLGRLVRATEPEAALLPGSIPQAHRGIIFVDEINRLAETSPELADVLLDAMGTKPGRIQIEETGLPPVELPVQVSIWAASNPDEDPGPLEEVRRQLSDRFDLAIYTDRPGDLAVVAQILDLAEQPGSRTRAVAETQAELWRTRLALRMASLRQVKMPAEMRQQVAGLYSRFELESLRAVQAMQAGVRLMACLDNRTEALPGDLQRIAPMALRHRVDPETVRKVITHLAGGGERDEGVIAGTARTRFPGLSFGGVVAEAPYGQAVAASQALPGPGHRAPGAGGSGGRGPVADEKGTRGRLPGAEEKVSAAGGRGPGVDEKAPGAVDRASGSESRAPGVGGSPSWFRRTLSQFGLGRPGDQGSSTPGLDRFGGGRTMASGAAAAGARLPDPAEHPPEAPPNLARPLSALNSDEWVRTEEELGRR